MLLTFKFGFVEEIVIVVGRGLAPAVTAKTLCHSNLFEISAGASPRPTVTSNPPLNPNLQILLGKRKGQ